MSGNRDDELRRLDEIRERLEWLMAAGDPLLRGQYQHLLGRVSALRAISAAGTRPSLDTIGDAIGDAS